MERCNDSDREKWEEKQNVWKSQKEDKVWKVLPLSTL